MQISKKKFNGEIMCIRSDLNIIIYDGIYYDGIIFPSLNLAMTMTMTILYSHYCKYNNSGEKIYTIYNKTQYMYTCVNDINLEVELCFV